MSLEYFLKAILLGLAIAAPVGPIGILCIRRSLTESRSRGLWTGLGAASADAIYGLIAGLGLTMISTFLVKIQLWLKLGGALFLAYLGLVALRSTPPADSPSIPAGSLTAAYFSTFLLTLSNPMTILSFLAVMTSAGLVETANQASAVWTLVAGIFCGSALWWLSLSYGVSRLTHWIGTGLIRRINRLAAIALLLFSVYLIVSGFIQFSR